MIDKPRAQFILADLKSELSFYERGIRKAEALVDGEWIDQTSIMVSILKTRISSLEALLQ